MTSKIIIPSIFAPLVQPNHTEEERKLFTEAYKADLKRRLIHGENVTADMFGVKTFVLKGGRISGKTQTDENATIQDFFGERGDIWYCRSTDNTIRQSIFTSMQSTIRSAGFTISEKSGSDFKASKAPFEIKCNATGNVCQFFAINNDINRTKSRFPPSGKLKKLILEEANEPNSEIFIEALKSTALRFMDEMGKIVFRYNPPPSLNAWANRYFPRLTNEGATLIHSTWEDIAGLLDPVVIAEIVKMRKEDPVHYSYWYGGEVVSLQGRVIWSFDRKKHLLSVKDLQYRVARNLYYQPVAMFYGVDSGLKADATTISAWALFPDGRLIKLSTFYFDIREQRRRYGLGGISHSDQVNMMTEWYWDFIERMKALGITIPDHDRERWCFDGAALTQDLMLEFEKATRFKCRPVTDKDIERDIARLVNSYRSNQLLILDTEDNAISVFEMENFIRDEENEIPEGQSDHTIDADKYATYEYYYNYL